MIIIDERELDAVIQTIKALPVQGGYRAADAWVGCVLTLENMKLNAMRYESGVCKQENG